MAQDDPFASRRKQHIMFAHNVAAANGGEADVAFLARPSDAVPAPVRDIG